MVGEPNFLSRTTLRPLRAEGDLDRVGEAVDAAQDRLARVLAVNNLLCHVQFLSVFNLDVLY